MTDRGPDDKSAAELFLGTEDRVLFSDDDTYAVREFKKALEKRRLFKFADWLGYRGKDAAPWLLYFYATNPEREWKMPTVFVGREKLRPALWYYRVGEKLPPEIAIKPLFKSADMYKRRSCGHLLLREIKESLGSFQAMADRYGFSIYIAKYFLYETKRNGKPQRRLPNRAFVEKFRDDINPDYWFIFPEEILDKKERARFLALKEKWGE